MKRSIIISSTFTLITFLNCLPQDRGLGALKNLDGTWAMETKKGPLYESWTLVNDAELRSKSFRLSQSNDTILLERVTLVANGEDIFYIPVVENQNNQQPVSFKLKGVEARKYIFENLAHDYPQRIIYDLISADSIVARIEGEKNGKAMGSNYYFNRSTKSKR